MKDQKRILGIDYGTHRVGISISDPLRIVATSYAALANNHNLLQRIAEIVEREDVEFVVVGMPYTLRGGRGRKAEEVEDFIVRLKDAMKKEVVAWDERFTTSLAQQTMLTMGTKRKERKEKKGRVDSMAAAITLQGFLDSTKQSMSC